MPLDQDGERSDEQGKAGTAGRRPSTARDGGASREPSASARAGGRTTEGTTATGGTSRADGTGSTVPGGGRSGSGAPGRSTDDDETGGPTPSGSTPPPPSAPTTPTTPTGPAVLEVGDPERAAAGERWCEKVTVEFRNTGGAPVTSGTVTFGTHVIDALGIDWATLESKEVLPAPIGAGQKREKTWTVCVDDWRLPLGMHIQTRDVSVIWKP
ncbi:hypothetical protein ABZS86_15300 [Streptomyces sp. NPDC005355]|uniref:hypothetical protein n=1 Tax=Streptomyces sp. NPDC005355 TaxID=3157038 RepID=UPI0033A7C928